MLFLRSLLFQLLFYLVFLIYGLMTPVALLMTSQFAWNWATQWMRGVLFVWRLSTNSTVEFRGLENIPDGGFIVAAKHQSAWETLGLAQVLYDIVYIMKQELMYIPVFGWFCRKARMIPISRGEGAKAVGPMIDAASQAISEGRRIVIFMEGTRVAPGTIQRYKRGVARMQAALDCPIVPVALNTGLFWPRNSFWRYTGHVIVEFLPPIMPGQAVQDVIRDLENKVEEKTNALILETAKSDNPPPTIHKALDALEARGIDVSDYR